MKLKRESIMSCLVLATIGLVCVVTTNLAVAAASNDFVTTWKTDNPSTSNSNTSGGEEGLPPPPPPPHLSCNVNTVSGVTEYFNATIEACEILVLGPDFIVADSANVSANSGWEIDFLPGFTVELGATLNANVCGQSLCLTSPSPMPYGCHSCVDQICDIEPACCALEFDQACLDMVGSECGLVCE